jgi:hypothetical protein
MDLGCYLRDCLESVGLLLPVALMGLVTPRLALDMPVISAGDTDDNKMRHKSTTPPSHQASQSFQHSSRIPPYETNEPTIALV